MIKNIFKKMGTKKKGGKKQNINVDNRNELIRKHLTTKFPANNISITHKYEYDNFIKMKTAVIKHMIKKHNNDIMLSKKEYMEAVKEYDYKILSLLYNIGLSDLSTKSVINNLSVYETYSYAIAAANRIINDDIVLSNFNYDDNTIGQLALLITNIAVNIKADNLTPEGAVKIVLNTFATDIIKLLLSVAK